MKDSENHPGLSNSMNSITVQPRGPFLESPGNFTGPKSKIQIEI